MATNFGKVLSLQEYAAKRLEKYTVKNNRPEDPIFGSAEKRIWKFGFNSRAENISTLRPLRRKLNYAVRHDGMLIIGEIDSQYCGHIDLANGEPILSAGEVKFLEGEICYVNNESGHYPNCGDTPFIAAQIAFQLWFHVNINGRYYQSTWDNNLRRWVADPSQPYASALVMKQNGGEPSRVKKEGIDQLYKIS